MESCERATGLRVDEDRICCHSVFIDAEHERTSFPLLGELGLDHGRAVTFVRLGIGVPSPRVDHGLRSIGY